MYVNFGPFRDLIEEDCNSFLVALIMMLTFSILKGFGALEILFSILALFAYSA